MILLVTMQRIEYMNLRQMTLYNIVYHIQYIKFSSYPVHESTKYDMIWLVHILFMNLQNMIWYDLQWCSTSSTWIYEKGLCIIFYIISNTYSLVNILCMNLQNMHKIWINISSSAYPKHESIFCYFANI